MRSLALLFLVSVSISCNRLYQQYTIDLSGEWAFKADPLDTGIQEKWFTGTLGEVIVLPGSMTENNKGDAVSLHTPWTGDIVDSSWFFDPAMAKYRDSGNIHIPFWLQPAICFTGPAWYQKEINIPPSWKSKYKQLFLERCHWETRVWIDDHEIGMQNSLGTPHVYELTKWLDQGRHVLTMRVDNRINDIDVGRNSHSISDHTQTNWNGIVGKLELCARSPFFLADAKLYPDLVNKSVNVKITLQNITGKPVNGKIRIDVRSLQKGRNEKIKPLLTEVSVSTGTQTIEINYPMGRNPQYWDEFNPNLYHMIITLKGAGEQKDTRQITFGMREFNTSGTQFTINGRPVFLRGTLECAIFPNTGYPPADTASWMRIFRIARAHGLNHMRFHSWCPPEAAFNAADRMGFYLQVECSSWANQGSSIGDGKAIDQYLYDESERIVNSYGNHPSFCMLLYGNEPAGVNQEKWLGDFVRYWKSKDPRRLYSSGAGWPIIPETDFNSTPDPRIQHWGEGLMSIINAKPPQTDFDWKDRIDGFDKPTVSHEIGQWCVYPDFKEIDRYQGVLKAKNFEIFKETLWEHGMGHLADSFLLASGKLQVLCYKADIEAALRTPGFGGFQLLDLHDFPGQGTALVGVLNAFWEQKGYVKAEEYRMFCNTIVPLVRLPKMVFLSSENLHAWVEVAHYGNKELKAVSPAWKLINADGSIFARGVLQETTIPVGRTTKLGEINQPLSALKKARKLILEVTVEEFKNYWDIWVYPAALPEIEDDIIITQNLSAPVLKALQDGGKVLLTPKKGSIRPEMGGSVAVGFSSIFWNTAWTSQQPPHTLGILCNPNHPALTDFPTEYHSNWQWWDAMSHSNAVLLSDFSISHVPIVRIIDDWVTNRPLALIFEANAGKGKIIVSGIDLITDADERPEARQLMYSLRHYMTGNSFEPSESIEIEKLKSLLK